MGMDRETTKVSKASVRTGFQGGKSMVTGGRLSRTGKNGGVTEGSLRGTKRTASGAPRKGQGNQKSLLSSEVRGITSDKG